MGYADCEVSGAEYHVRPRRRRIVERRTDLMRQSAHAYRREAKEEYSQLAKWCCWEGQA